MALPAKSSMPINAKIKATKLRYIALQNNARERIGGALNAKYLDAESYLSVSRKFLRKKDALELSVSSHEEPLDILNTARDFLRSLDGGDVLVEFPNYLEFGAAQTCSKIIASNLFRILWLADDDIRILGSDLSCNLEISADRSAHDKWCELNLFVSGSRWQRLFSANADVRHFTRKNEVGALK